MNSDPFFEFSRNWDRQNDIDRSLLRSSFCMPPYMHDQRPNYNTLGNQLNQSDFSLTGSSSAVNSDVTSSTRTPWGLTNAESLQLMPYNNNTIPNRPSHHLNTTDFRKNPRKTYVCNLCGYKIKGFKQIDEHTFTVHGKYRCTHCNKTFTQRRSLNYHAAKHLPEKPFHCKMCVESYSLKNTLLVHIVRKHKISRNDAELHIKSDITPAIRLKLLEQIDGQHSHASKSIQLENNETVQSNVGNISSISSFAPLSNQITFNNYPTSSSSMSMSIKQLDGIPQQQLFYNI